jgi:hypothetical protein
MRREKKEKMIKDQKKSAKSEERKNWIIDAMAGKTCLWNVGAVLFTFSPSLPKSHVIYKNKHNMWISAKTPVIWNASVACVSTRSYCFPILCEILVLRFHNIDCPAIWQL